MSRCSICKDRPWFSWAAALALVFQPYTASRTSVALAESALVASAVPMKTIDVAMQRGGVLQGQVVNAAGVGIAETTVELASGRQHWQTTTDAKGGFQIAHLRGGTYQLSAAKERLVMRVWTTDAAPPSASQGVLLASTSEVVRGQRVVSPKINQFFRFSKQKLVNPWVVGGIVATAVAIPVAIHNADDDDPPATP